MNLSLMLLLPLINLVSSTSSPPTTLASSYSFISFSVFPTTQTNNNHCSFFGCLVWLEMGRGNKSATTNCSKWRCCQCPSYYYLNRPNSLALLFIASVCVSLFVWDSQTLFKEHQGLLAFYDLPQPHSLIEVKVKPSSSLPNGVKFELHTLPVDAKAVSDGDTLTVYVRITKPWESSFVPSNVCIAAMQRSEARARRDYKEADSFHKQIIHAGYRVLNFQNEEILARKYRIRLRGIDSPEGSMSYGKEAKNELTRVVQGKSLRVLVYGEDYYSRFVGDIYCNGIFVQELMLKKGLAWHYTAYDKRPELETWEREARAKQVGLWALSNPQKPWEWRKDQREAK